MKDILDILNPSSFAFDQLETLDGDTCIFENFNDRGLYQAEAAEDLQWARNQQNQTANQTQNLRDQGLNLYDYEETNISLEDVDLKLGPNGQIQQLLDTDANSLSSTYENEVLSQLPDDLNQNADDIMNGIDHIPDDLAVQLQSSEFWNEQPQPVIVPYQVNINSEYDHPIQDASTNEQALPYYTATDQIYYLENGLDQYIESEIYAELERNAVNLNVENNLTLDNANSLQDIDLNTTITYHLLHNDEFGDRLSDDEIVNLPIGSEVIIDRKFEISKKIIEQSNEESSSKNKNGQLGADEKCVNLAAEENSEDDVDYFSDVEVDDPNDHDYCPNEIELLMEMGFGPNIYNKIPERREGYNLRSRGKRTRIKVKNIREINDINEESPTKHKGRKKSVNRRRKANLTDVSESKKIRLNEVVENDEVSEEEINRKIVKHQINNDALKQLLSPGIRKCTKQHKTITFLGEDPKYGRTVQKMEVDDPAVKCVVYNNQENPEELEPGEKSDVYTKKKYQCGKCDMVFEELSSFKEHNKCAVDHYRIAVKRCKRVLSDYDELRFMCSQCGKTLKNQDKFEMHCRGHGDPDVECETCRKVFATKATLRNHKRLHEREFLCHACYKSFDDVERLHKHESKNHSVHKCDFCDKICKSNEDLDKHLEQHMNPKVVFDSENDTENSVVNNIVYENEESEIMSSDVIDELNQCDIENNNSLPQTQVLQVDNKSNVVSSQEQNKCLSESDEQEENLKKADDMMAKVLATDIFEKGNKGNKSKYHNKVCNVCGKTFDRVSDLKRHLIEHVIRINLLKNPVGKDGALRLQCEICQRQTFTKIDKYKAHLREHAKLTLYQCKFCDKSFSDSSNFSKHKKVHGAPSFQCDLCQRKFNSKKMISQHMEYHSNTEPINCEYCEKVFHFESNLKKHLKMAHVRNKTAQFRCKLCHQYFKSLKEKWDHEWIVHSIRKMVADCTLCDKKFRKHSELKRHYTNVHNTVMYLGKK